VDEHSSNDAPRRMDITERRSVEEVQARLAAIVENSDDAIFAKSLDGTILTWNAGAQALFGYTSKEAVGQSVELLVPPERRAELVETLDRVRAGQSISHLETVRRRKDGTEVVVALSISLLRDADGRMTGASTIARDVTESRTADERLRESEERYRVLFDESPMPMWLYDPGSLRIVMANHAAAEQYGYTMDELLALALPDVFRPEDAEKIRAAVRALPLGRSYVGTWKHRRKDGSLLDVDMHRNDVRLGGRTLRLAVLHDVTRRRNLEEERRQSQKMEAVGRLAGGVAHDFNNLLTAILGYSDLLASRFHVGDPERAEIQEIRRAGERAAALTRQLLAFSRKQVLLPEVLDLDSVVRGLLRLLERLIGENITVSLVVAPDLGRVLADPGQMEQVVMNLAVNARDAMPRGGELRVEIQNVDLDDAFASEHIGVTPGPHVLLAVTDTGVGMAPEVQKQIFEPFFTTKRTGEGTGLGLSTVHGIVNQSGGTIWVDSEPGRGTTFKIYLPRIVGAAAAAQLASGTFPSLEGSGTILLVEDDEQLRQLARRILELSGYTVLEARSPEVALRIAREHDGPIHVLLTDVVMPGMSGPELAASLQRERPSMPVLYMSGYTDNAIAHHGVLDPGTQLIQKPFTPNRLVQRVREVMRETL
jgi:two-component system cell cycle sensor histidine kinase/response regulator CckA